MEFSFGTLQLNRTEPSHVGTSPLVSTLGNAKKAGKAAEGLSEGKGLFESYLTQAVEQMNSQQTTVEKMAEKIAVDPDSVDIHDVTIAMAKAKASMDLAHTVISRLISGWTELSQNR